MIYYPAVTRVLPLTTIRRERILPVAGEVLVRIGDRVDPLQVVARAEVPGRYFILELAETLGVAPDDADKYVRVKRNQPVKAGQVVAQRRAGLGLVSRVVRAPKQGIVVAVGGGRVLLESVGKPEEVRAYVPGVVGNVLPKLGVLIETVGSLIQCAWGMGKESFGVLKVLAKRPNRPLQARSIDVACHGAVLVGGSTMDNDALQQALELQVRGIVIGSLDPTLLDVVQEMPFPIIATEGIGYAPMAAPIFRLLSTNDGREAAISGMTQPRWGAVRPEVVIPLPTPGAATPPLPEGPLAVGDRVRVIREPALGQVGTIESLPDEPLVLETGAQAWGAIVALEDDQNQPIPFFNLELLG